MQVEVRGPDRILELGLGFWASKVLLTAVELGVFSELARGPLDAETLRQRLGLQRRGLHDFLDALVSLGMLHRHEGQYQNTAETDLFLDRAKPSYVGGMLEMANGRLYRFWGSLTEALKTGRPQNEIKHGENIFDAIYGDPASLEGFLRGMTGISRGSAMAIAERFPWNRFQTFVDVGAAQGALVAEVCKRHPHMQATGFDLPPVEPVFTAFMKELGLTDRAKFAPGNFFNDALPTADVIVMGHVLHDWSADEKRALVRKAYDALPAGGALVVYEAIIDDDRRQNTFGLLMSLNMLIETHAGFDYTGADCSAWMREAGFSDTSVEHLLGPDSMVIGWK